MESSLTLATWAKFPFSPLTGRKIREAIYVCVCECIWPGLNKIYFEDLAPFFKRLQKFFLFHVSVSLGWHLEGIPLFSGSLSSSTSGFLPPPVFRAPVWEKFLSFVELTFSLSLSFIPIVASLWLTRALKNSKRYSVSSQLTLFRFLFG